MKNFIATAIFAILSMSAAAASAQDVLTESFTDGNTVQSRSLASNGMLTESTCQTATSTSDGALMQKCSTRQTKLTAKASRALHSQMMSAYSGQRQQAQDLAYASNRVSVSQLESGAGLSKSVSSDALSKFQPASKAATASITESISASQSASKKFARISATYCGTSSAGECASLSKTGTNVATQSVALRN